MIEVGRLYEELSRKQRRLELFVDRLLSAQEAREVAIRPPLSPENERRPGSAGPNPEGRRVSRRSGEPTVDRLSPRELEVLQLLVEGSTNKEIATRLSLSPDTVKNHVLRITQKLGAADRTQAAVTAIREGLVK